MKRRLTRLAERLSTSYWLVPSLCVMVGRRFPSSAREDEEGLLRLVCPRPDWNAYVPA